MENMEKNKKKIKEININACTKCGREYKKKGTFDNFCSLECEVKHVDEQIKLMQEVRRIENRSKHSRRISN